MNPGLAVTVFAIVDAAAEDLPQVLAALADLARLSAAEPGCLRYEVHQSAKDPGRLFIHEIWADAAALEDHRGTAHIAAFKVALAQTAARVWASPFNRLI